jgi:hypothetical protein
VSFDQGLWKTRAKNRRFITITFLLQARLMTDIGEILSSVLNIFRDAVEEKSIL